MQSALEWIQYEGTYLVSIKPILRKMLFEKPTRKTLARGTKVINY
jgi:hypothetical protein